MTTALRDELDFISHTAPNQPSGTDSERGELKTLCISNGDDGGVSEVDGEPEEEDKPDYGGSIPLDTNDLGIPVEHEPERNNLTSDWRTMAAGEPITGVIANPPYSHYGPDAPRVTGGGGDRIRWPAQTSKNVNRAPATLQA